LRRRMVKPALTPTHGALALKPEEKD
jgi:hypothetical protein